MNEREKLDLRGRNEVADLGELDVSTLVNESERLRAEASRHLYALGLANWKDYAAAASFFEEALAIWPENSTAKNALATIKKIVKIEKARSPWGYSGVKTLDIVKRMQILASQEKGAVVTVEASAGEPYHYVDGSGGIVPEGKAHISWKPFKLWQEAERSITIKKGADILRVG